MSFPHSGFTAYRQTQVQSRTPLELVVMLYDGALQSLSTARGAITRHDIPARRDALAKALAIISELQSTLNLKEGGTTAASLDGLYDYANRRLLDAATRNDVVPIDEVRHLFETLRDAWRTISVPAVVTAEAAV